MIQHVWELASQAGELDRVVVATDDEGVLQTALGFGAKALMTPVGLPSGTDRVAFVARETKAAYIVNVQGDEPLLEPECIDLLVRELKAHPEAGIATLAVEKTDLDEWNDQNVVKVSFSEKGDALYFSRLPLNSASPGRFFKHIGIYAFRREALLRFCELPASRLEKEERLEQMRALENGIGIRVVKVTSETIAVDTPGDIARVEAAMKGRN